MRSLGNNHKLLVVLALCLFSIWCVAAKQHHKKQPLRFARDGEFKILQVADMHYANGKATKCLDVSRSQYHRCSDLNTIAFIRRLILAENPDLIVFSGDNIMGYDVEDPIKSLNAAFEPAITSNIPWAAILGNHDQECALGREGVMKHIVSMKNTLSRVYPKNAPSFIDGFGNYNLEVHGAHGTRFENKSVLNLYMIDSGDNSKVDYAPGKGYDWIKASQICWFERTSKNLQRAYNMGNPETQKEPAPGLVYIHIPVPEVNSFGRNNMTGVKQEESCNPDMNSGFFTSMVTQRDVKALFYGHDHVNDFCGKLTGIQMCYAGGIGYHAYGQVGWDRRARVVTVNLEKTRKGGRWGEVKHIRTWKRLDDQHLNAIEAQVLWTKGEKPG